MRIANIDNAAWRIIRFQFGTVYHISLAPALDENGDVRIAYNLDVRTSSEHCKLCDDEMISRIPGFGVLRLSYGLSSAVGGARGRIGVLSVLLVAWLVLVSCTETGRVPDSEFLDEYGAVVEERTLDQDELSQVRTGGGVLKYPTTFCSDPDPAIDHSITWRNIANPPLVTEIHAGLTQVSEYAADGYELALASSVRVSDDLLEYEFTLRSSLKFSDGSPLTSRDVKWSWARALSLGSETSRVWRVLGPIEGAVDVLGSGGELKGVEVVDDRRFRVQLERPFVDFRLHLSDPVASVLNRRNVESWPERSRTENTSSVVFEFDFSREVVGAGPFRLVSTSEGRFGASSCSLEWNSHYWGEPPSLARVDLVQVFDPFPSDEAAPPRRVHEVFAQGEIDVSMPDHDGSDSDFPTEDGSIGNFAPVHGEIRYGVLVFNPSFPPFDDVELRKALVGATELPSELLDDWSVGADRRVIPRSVIESSVASRVASVEPLAGGSMRDGAYQGVVIDAPIEQGPPDFYGVLMHDLVAQWEASLGLEVVLNSEPLAYDNAFRTGDLPFRVLTGSLSVPEPLHLLRRLTTPFGGRHESEEFRAALEMVASAESEPDRVVREQMALEVERYLLDNALVLPLVIYESEYEVRVQPWVRGFEYRAYPHSLFAAVWLEDAPPDRYE